MAINQGDTQGNIKGSSLVFLTRNVEWHADLDLEKFHFAGGIEVPDDPQLNLGPLSKS